MAITNPVVQHISGLRADFNTLVASNGLIPRQLYLISDENNRIVVATSVNTYSEYAPKTELSINSTAYIASVNLAKSAPVALNSIGQLVAASTSLTSPVVGFTMSAVTANNSVFVRNVGELDGFTSLTVGNPVYLANGAITQTRPTSGRMQVLGTAISATKILIQIEPMLMVVS